MKKKLVMMLVTAMTLGVLVGCGNSKDESTDNTDSAEVTQEEESEKEVPSIYLGDYDVESYVTLGEYKGLEATTTKIVIPDEQVESFVQYALASTPNVEEVTDRAIEEGDTVNIDYVGKKDGVAFDGGTAEGYDLVIGSNTFIDGFEEGLIGAELGDVLDLNLTFPEEYQSEDLAGAEVVFTVTVNSISVTSIPELTDEYVVEQGIEGCETVEEFKEYVRQMLYDNAAATEQANIQMSIIDTLMEASTFTEIPEEILEFYSVKIANNLEMQAMQYGMDTLQFVSLQYGMTEEDYEAELATSAELSAKQALICQAIANIEGFNPTDEEVDAKMEEEAILAGFTSADEYKQMININEFRDYMMSSKVMDFLVENAVITELDETEEAETEEVEAEEAETEEAETEEAETEE